jgi:enterochelin esterase-like enzyme
LVVALLAVTLPVFGDMVNYTPDVRMRTGWDPNASATAVGGDQSGAASSSPGSSAPAGQPSVAPDPGASKIPTPSGGSGTGLPTGTPWKAWQPSGSGSMTALQMPAPWTGGTHATATLDIYTPPGYGTGSRAYPVMYSVPWGVSGGWTSVVGIRAMLDTLIERGTIPAQIVAFVSAEGGPYPDSECVNSVDGRQAFDTYFATTVVPYVDAHYRTIATPAARSIMGFSQGGYCATMLMLRHPTLFSSAISFSGYYQAGIRSSETPNAWRPFNGDPTVEAAWSPLKLAGQVAAAQRKDLFLILEADPSEGFFGPQYNQMIAAARAAGIGLALFPSSLGHGWIAPRGLLPGVLVALAERQVSLGVFR